MTENNIKLDTQRLILIPLLPAQLRLWVEDLPALEQELGCSYQAEPMEGFFLEIVKGQAAKAQADPANYLYHSFWFLLRKEDRAVVGSADFKDVPNKEGAVEIGYGLGKRFEGSGYMTEAVDAMCEWALAQKKVTQVIAETEAANPKSQNVLGRCGFSLLRQEENLWWRRVR